MSLQGSTIAIVGSSSGIGQAIVKQLAELGANLSLADRVQEKLDAQAKTISAAGGQCMAFQTNIRDTAAVDAWIQQTVDRYGKLDGAVNCAGVTLQSSCYGSCL